MADEKQMDLFKDGGITDDGMNVDPVSGNEVPPGSLAEEVRDDIPAQLSGGEYVVPADVLRFYGVRFFENLREQAKEELQEMEQQGRIGGEPVPAGGPMNDDDLSEEEMRVLTQSMGMAMGGGVPGQTQMFQNQVQAQQPVYGMAPQAIGNTAYNEGGQVRGYAPGGFNPFMYTLGSTIFPSEKTGQTVGTTYEPTTGSSTGAETTADAVNSTATSTTGTETGSGDTIVTLYGPDGQVITLVLPRDQGQYDQLMATGNWTLENPNVPTTKSDDGPTTPTGTDTDKGSGDQYTGFVDSVAATDDYSEWVKDKLAGGGTNKFLSGAAALLGGLPMAGILNVGQQLNTLSDAKAAGLIAEALGRDDEAKKINDLIDTYVGNMAPASKFLADMTSKGTGKFEAWKNQMTDINARGNLPDLTRDDFGSDSAYEDFMNDIGPSGMTFDPSITRTYTEDDGTEVTTTGGYVQDDDYDPWADLQGVTTTTSDSGVTVHTITDSDAFTESGGLRPVLRPGSGSDDNDSGPVGIVGNNDTGSNSLAQSIANALTPGDGKEYQNGVLVSTSSNDDNDPSPSNDDSGGCCFIMLEARYGNGTMDSVVRRYRDEYMTDRNRRGYYKTAEVLVPLMRKSKLFKWVVTKTFADPLVAYGKYYYGENKYGIIFTPVKNFWMKLFDVVGGDTEFIRENGEVV